MGPGGGPRWGFPQLWVHQGKRRAAPQHNIFLGTAGHGACFHSRAAPAVVPGGGARLPQLLAPVVLSTSYRPPLVVWGSWLGVCWRPSPESCMELIAIFSPGPFL